MSGPGSGKVHPLKGQQKEAVDPRHSVWLSASAGTGKTQVLSARVLRLLMTEGVAPSQILCLTFTKAGAAEMATRVNDVLAEWVRMPETQLFNDLQAIGAKGSQEEIARARALFAQVLDCPGGGLRIDTIHAFSQWLLAAFPEEAGLVPGTRPMEDRDKDLLAYEVLADLLVEWEERGDTHMLRAVADLSLRMGEDKVRGWLMRCADAREAWFGPSGWQEPLEERVRSLIGLASDALPETLHELCGDDAFDCAALRHLLHVYAGWNAKSGSEAADLIPQWLAADAPARMALFDALAGVLFYKNGNPKLPKAADSAAIEASERVKTSLLAFIERRALLAIADLLVPALTVGRRFALRWDEAKTREGLIDFDDQIRQAAALLQNSALSDWIRYKLDRQFDHILIDEAQDTNAAQWSIIDALTGDYFAGEGQKPDRLRTIFVVGDYKQAIFRFQGTSPENFEAARRRYERIMAELASNDPAARELQGLDLDRSYRTAQAVLDFVDAAIEGIGHAAFGLAQPPEQHIGDERPGLVTLWQPVKGEEDDGQEADEDAPDTWLPGPERKMADRIAEQVKAWLRDGFPLVKGEKRNAGPGDIMVLVRKRRELAGLIVARLHAAGVPVAGVDRLRLGAPLAVKDLMAALRFAAQPHDDLALANLLASPLGGWSQQDLLEYGYRKEGVRLWDHLRHSREPRAVDAKQRLLDLLRRADFEPPQALLHWLLVGPWQGRKTLVARLGREANDPIDELLNAAQAYAAAHTPSLQGFIHWFDAGDGDIKREAGAGANEDGGLVRVMTVHGSKGLQAPIVILADATGDPDRSPPRGLTLEEELPGGGGRTMPLPDLSKDERIGRIAAAEEAARIAERQEHWRLLYVAMTRAEEALFVGGALLGSEEEPKEDSWFARLNPLVDALPLEDPIWGWRLEHGEHAPPVPRGATDAVPAGIEPPAWTTTPVGPEPRPPRPLAPSAAGQDEGADPPFPPGASAFAARRGVLIHRLLERLPEVPPLLRVEVARDWLARQAGEVAAGEREAMLASALAVLDEPGWAQIFSPEALAEVPLVATVGGQAVVGTADRLLVTDDRVLVVDFKTARRPPANLAEVPLSTLRQMAAYVAALEVIYPGRVVEAAVLYTHAPSLIALPPEVIAAHKAALHPPQESFPA